MMSFLVYVGCKKATRAPAREIDVQGRKEATGDYAGDFCQIILRPVLLAVRAFSKAKETGPGAEERDSAWNTRKVAPICIRQERPYRTFRVGGPGWRGLCYSTIPSMHIDR